MSANKSVNWDLASVSWVANGFVAHFVEEFLQPRLVVVPLAFNQRDFKLGVC